ncbi:disease resistance protein RPM1-like [Lolium rigidum]|uniref:disease resistance protein RPM1-like n=1 Tax=Lolium rigidum TaxID=89674 RepID=UPI001F5D219A|nr:disease resistance protein RPM1-like [Lolium rigidum]
MAEAILAAVTKIGMIGASKAATAAGELLAKKVNGLMELPGKIKMIDKELRMLNGVIQDLGSSHLSNNVIKEWITGVRNLAYHVEDVVDKYLYEAVKVNEEDFLSRYVFNMGGARNAIVFSKIVVEVAEIEIELKQVKENQAYWTNTIVPVNNDRAEIDRQRSGGGFQGLFCDEDLVGIDENRSKLTEWLSTDEKDSTVITISGMGGLGKTTLVRNVYDREKGNFPGGQAWIVVSQKYDVVDLLTKLLSKIGQSQPVSAKPDVDDLTNAIQKTLQYKKCLIVLDDVWNEEAYNQMHNAFKGSQGSRVMITTRKEKVAAIAHNGRRMIVQPLGSTESYKLFCSRAFHNTSPDPDRKCPPELRCPPELETVAAAIADRCHGLPLAIVACGSLLSKKEPTEHAWDQMYNQLRSKLQENNHVQAILILSYHDLPGNLRNCFLYCSLFPEDYPMPRESLVRMWVAEGFAIRKDQSTAEEVAEDNLMELISRNMLEVVERDELSRVTTCKMHDIVRSLALDIAKEERFGSANDEGEMINTDTEVRRFSTCGWKGDGSRPAAAGVKFPRLRTVMSIASSTSMISSILSGSNYLTVLELQDSGISQLPETIGNLFNLRYIGLRRTNIESLPDSIEKLSNLETLDIKQTKIVKLPPGIVKVEKLRHLFADRFADERQTEFRYFVGVEAPKMISNCHDLQTLETVCASKDLSQQLRKMTKLQTVWIDNINASNCEDLFEALSYMPLLSSVLLSASDERETLSFEKLKPISTKLTRLIVRGGWAHGTLNCPIFQGSGRYLRYLALSWCNLGEEDPLKLLASQVPALTYLSLNRVSSAAILVLSAGCFPKLKTLVLKNMPNVNQLVIEDNAIPAIHGIYIVSLREMNMAPHGIDCLGSLKKLWLLGLHRDFKADWDLKQMHNKLKHVPELRS